MDLIQGRAESGTKPIIGDEAYVAPAYTTYDAPVAPEPAVIIARAREQADPGRKERERKARRNAADRRRRAKRWDARIAAGDRPRGFRPRP